MPEFITVEEAATMLKVDPATIRNWLKAGKIEGKKIPGTKRWRINLDKLKKFLS